MKSDVTIQRLSHVPSFAALAAGLFLAFSAGACGGRDAEAEQAVPKSAVSGQDLLDVQDEAARVERGRYLVSIMGCHDCHTPWVMGPNGPGPDMTRALSGHPQDVKMPAAPSLDMPWGWAGAATNTAFAGPWGVSFTANLTPDSSGLGIWTKEMFITAIREGKHMGVSRPILPPMPWTVYRNATDEDLGAIYSYLRTIPPIKNFVPEPIEPVRTTASR